MEVHRGAGSSSGRFDRMRLLAGSEAARSLTKTSVIVFGLGGVGSWACEALVRSGVGRVCIVDGERVCLSNINRQAGALTSTVGRYKSDALAERLYDINPSCEVLTLPVFFSKENSGVFGIGGYDYVIDAIDSMPAKLDLIEAAVSLGQTRLYSSMGMAGRLDPTLVKTACVWQSGGCALARAVRAGLRARGYSGSFTVVFSRERFMCCGGAAGGGDGSNEAEGEGNEVEGQGNAAGGEGNGRKPLGSAVTVTAAAGLCLASLVLRDVCARLGAEGV